MAKHQYQKGNGHGKGGKRAGAGRPPDKLKQTAKDLAGERVDKALEVIDKILSGKDGGAKERLSAAELVLAYAWHKPTQPTQVEAELVFAKEYGPDAPLEDL